MFTTISISHHHEWQDMYLDAIVASIQAIVEEQQLNHQLIIQ
jgi:hypothetical protein